MPPNSTQNLNAKLTLTVAATQRSGAIATSPSPPPIHNSGTPVRIVGASARYQGGYHLAGL
jgi:hypothetical protein